jgi:hypothetical protein
VYRFEGSGRPLQTLEVSRFLRVDWRSPEVDIEGAGRIGDRIYWITSHGRSAKGEERTSRQRIFATDINRLGGFPRLVPVGLPYLRLLPDLLADARLQPFGLPAAAELAPKSEGALNIEGLGATPEGHLLIGFRNPIIHGKALVVPLLNPSEVILGQAARLGDPQLVDLGGLGIRSISDWCGQYFMVGGASGEGGVSRLFTWDGKPGAPKPMPAINLAGFNPESVALASRIAGDQLLLISDDGTLKMGGKLNKKIKDPNLRRFRALLLPLPHELGLVKP